MKIALISLARRGGMVHFLAELANALASMETITAIVSCGAEGGYFARGVSQIRVNTGQGRLHSFARSLSPLTWFNLFRSLRRVDADLLHIVGVHQWNPAVAALCRMLGKPLVYTVHDPQAHPGTPWSLRAADWIVSRIADHLVVLTRDGRRRLTARGLSDERISMVHHPMYSLFRRWRPVRRTSAKVILYFGRIEAYKGLEHLVQAFVSVQSSLPGWRLIIAGHGKIPDSLVAAADRNVRFLNHYLSDRQVAVLVNKAAFLVLPYTSATQSGVVALAQAFGRPVVATRVGGLSEMIVQGRTGILVRPGDIRSLGAAMRLLAGDRTRLRRMQRATARLAERNWNPRAVARAHAAIYRRVLRRRTRP